MIYHKVENNCVKQTHRNPCFLVYLPTFTINITHSCRQNIQSSHGNPMGNETKNSKSSSWWFQPIFISQIGSFPQIGMNLKNVSPLRLQPAELAQHGLKKCLKPPPSLFLVQGSQWDFVVSSVFSENPRFLAPNDQVYHRSGSPPRKEDE